MRSFSKICLYYFVCTLRDAPCCCCCCHHQRDSVCYLFAERLSTDRRGLASIASDLVPTLEADLERTPGAHFGASWLGRQAAISSVPFCRFACLAIVVGRYLAGSQITSNYYCPAATNERACGQQRRSASIWIAFSHCANASSAAALEWILKMS